MTVPASIIPRVPYTCNGVTTQFFYGFAVYSLDDIQVVETVTATGIETYKVLTTDWTVLETPNANGFYLSGITVVANVAPDAGTTWTIIHDPVVKQAVDLVDNTALPVEAQIETPLDRLTLMVSAVRSLVTRSLRQPAGDVADITTLPSKVDRALKYLGFSAEGDPIALASPAGTSVVSPFMATVLDDATAAAARATLGVNSASTAGEGLSELATDAEALAMTDTTRTLTPSNLAYLRSQGLIPDTGDGKITWKTTAYPGWVLANDGTIGDATSGATNRANADCSALFQYLWNNYADALAPVIGGRGGSAAADWAAHKQLRLLRVAGRALAGLGAAVALDAGTHTEVSTGSDTLTVPTNVNKWITGMPIVITYTGTLTGAGISSGATLYVYRNSSTTIKLCTTLANAQNGTVIDITAASGLAWTITYTDPDTHVGGEHSGEHAHAESSTEQLAHTHTTTAVNNAAGAVCAAGADKGTQSITSSSRGGNAAMNIVQPTSYWTIQVKL
jgi:hypothetical protein